MSSLGSATTIGAAIDSSHYNTQDIMLVLEELLARMTWNNERIVAIEMSLGNYVEQSISFPIEGFLGSTTLGNWLYK